VLRTSIVARVAALAASAIVHVTAFAVAGGHAREIGNESVDPTIEVGVDVRDDVPVPASVPTATEPPEPDARPHSHTHPYPVAPSHDETPHDPALVHLPALAPAPEVAAATRVLTASPSEPVPRFAIVVGAAPHASDGAVATRERSEAPGEAVPIAAERATTPARLLAFASPEYPAEARAQGIEARVVLEIVVDTAGRVKSARVARSAAPGFERAALAAMRSYRFAPAKLEGRAVTVRMPWSVEFQLQ
jgi:protein TonB